VTGQRVVAVVLTVLLFALIIVGSVAIARVFGYPAWGWFIGVGICGLMVVGFLRQSNPPPPPPDHRSRRSK
jgi:hypothetical protein